MPRSRCPEAKAGLVIATQPAAGPGVVAGREAFRTVQGADVITILSPADAKVVVLNATNAVITATDPAGVSDLTAVQKIPQGTEGNFSVVVNATLQVMVGHVCMQTIQTHTYRNR